MKVIDVVEFVIKAAAFLGACGVIIKICMSGFTKILDDKLKPLNKKIDDKFDPLNSKIDNIELSNAKNFIVRTLADIETGVFIDEVVKERFYENYEVYQKLGGNSYVKYKVEKLREEGKL